MMAPKLVNGIADRVRAEMFRNIHTRAEADFFGVTG